MPYFDDPIEKMKKIQKYMSDLFFFCKGSTVRTILVSNVYGLCDSKIVHADQSKTKPQCALLDVEMPMAKNCIS